MKQNIQIMAIVLVLTLSLPAMAGEWTLDAAHSSVAFSVKHLGLSNVKGQFKEFSAVVTADDATGKLSAVKAEAKVGSIDTGIGARDEHLKAPDFFDAAQFPVITLSSAKISFSGDKVTIRADVTMKGVTKSVTFTGTYAGARKADLGYGPQVRSAYSLSGVINRQDFGLSFNKVAEGVSVVGDQVTITLDIELFRPASQP